MRVQVEKLARKHLIDIIYVVHIWDSKQNFNHILKINNYFKNYSDI